MPAKMPPAPGTPEEEVVEHEVALAGMPRVEGTRAEHGAGLPPCPPRRPPGVNLSVFPLMKPLLFLFSLPSGDPHQRCHQQGDPDGQKSVPKATPGKRGDNHSRQQSGKRGTQKSGGNQPARSGRRSKVQRQQVQRKKHDKQPDKIAQPAQTPLSVRQPPRRLLTTAIDCIRLQSIAIVRAIHCPPFAHNSRFPSTILFSSFRPFLPFLPFCAQFLRASASPREPFSL